MKLSDYYGKRVYDKNDGRSGYILEVFADGTSIAGFLCADEAEREFYAVPCGAKVDDRVIFTAAHGKKAVKLALGRACFSEEGKFLGCLKEAVCRGLTVVSAKIGTKTYPAGRLVLGDAVIVKTASAELRRDVVRDGKILFRKGEPFGEKLTEAAISSGEYVQTALKTID